MPPQMQVGDRKRRTRSRAPAVAEVAVPQADPLEHRPGVVLTREHIAELILDLVDYRAERDLAGSLLLDPCCGEGVFVMAALRRLLASAKRYGRPLPQLGSALRAVDIDEAAVVATKQRVLGLLQAEGVAAPVAAELVAKWCHQVDYLLWTEAPVADFVVGNPPYVRIEQLASEQLAAYRARYVSLFDRADLYVAFIERSLALLGPTGLLSFVCADRWTRNRYGGRLRRLISEHYQVRCYLDLSQASPFESTVFAYPSIFVIGQKQQAGPSPVAVVTLRSAQAKECQQALRLVQGVQAQDALQSSAPSLQVHARWFVGDEPWVLSSQVQRTLLQTLESRFPALADCAETRVGIGVATGCDRVFVLTSEQAEQLEPDCLLPLVMCQDLAAGQITHSERWVINTFAADGRPIDLGRYPKLDRYLSAHREPLAKRYIARRSPAAWFRTIDRVYPELVQTPKLLIPDIANANQVTLDPGHYYPHHNLYYLTSQGWDLAALGGLLSSKVALFFVWSYAVTLRGGYLRFQAQYLRRIRVPRPTDVPLALQDKLRRAFCARDFHAIDELALTAYGIDSLPHFDFTDTRK